MFRKILGEYKLISVHVFFALLPKTYCIHDQLRSFVFIVHRFEENQL